MKLGQENKIMIKNFPTLYSKNNDGSIQQWNISVKDNIIIKKYGKINGKIQETKDEINAGKNIGKVNETSPEEQTLSEAQSQWEKKLKSGYCQTEAEARQGKVDTAWISGGAEPMLAHKFRDHESKITYPAYSQPKLDGHRCIAIIYRGKCELWSRTRKPITSVPHIIKAMEETFPKQPIVCDGELYNHLYKNKFEEITSLIRSQSPKENHTVVEYHVYDLVSNTLTFKERTEKIQKIKFASDKIVKVETRKVNNVEELMEYFTKDLETGYEGSMVRNSKSLYKHGRSYDLQKIKSFSDDEFEIIGVKNGKGRMVDCAIFICRTKTGNEFSCKMEGSLGNLKKYLINPEIVIGKQITVKFQNLTSDGLPRFPVGVRVEEDI